MYNDVVDRWWPAVERCGYHTTAIIIVIIIQCCYPRWKSLSSRIIEDQFTSLCPSRTLNPWQHHCHRYRCRTSISRVDPGGMIPVISRMHKNAPFRDKNSKKNSAELPPQSPRTHCPPFTNPGSALGRYSMSVMLLNIRPSPRSQKSFTVHEERCLVQQLNFGLHNNCSR